MPGIVDPGPWWKAELEAKRAALAAATDDADRARLQGEIHALENERRGHGWRRILRILPW